MILIWEFDTITKAVEQLELQLRNDDKASAVCTNSMVPLLCHFVFGSPVGDGVVSTAVFGTDQSS